MTLVTLTEAIHALKQGATIRRQIWDGAKLNYVPESENNLEYIQVTLWNGRKTSWNPITEDILAEDWIIE